MEITKRSAQWSAPQAVSKPGICEIKANHAMTHSHSNRGYRGRRCWEHSVYPRVDGCAGTTGVSPMSDTPQCLRHDDLPLFKETT